MTDGSVKNKTIEVPDTAKVVPIILYCLKMWETLS